MKRIEGRRIKYPYYLYRKEKIKSDFKKNSIYPEQDKESIYNDVNDGKGKNVLRIIAGHTKTQNHCAK